MENLNQIPNQETYTKEVVISDGIKYGVDKLIEIGKTIEPQDTAVTEFEKTMGTECWDDSNGKMIKPKEVLEAMKNGTDTPELKDHMDRIKKSDSSHPILVVDIEGELVVIDGVHRLVKSFFENKISIPVIKFNSLPKGAQVI